MTVTNPPATTTPVAFKTWAQLVADEVNGHTTDIAAIDDHIADSADAHDASAISFTPAGSIAATTVQAAIEEVAAEALDALDADAVVDLFSGTPDGSQFLRDDGSLAVPAGGGGGSNGLVARHIYSTSSTKTAATTSLTDYDATNLAITFTVPASGNVAVRLYGASAVSANSELWGLRESTTQVGNVQFMGNTSAILRKQAIITVTGLTPAASKTYKWAGKVSSAATSTIYIGGSGGIDGDAVMEVWEIP